MTKFEVYIVKFHHGWYDDDAKKEIEQALTQAEKKGAKAERERIFALLGALNGKNYDERNWCLNWLKAELSK
jgi:hypothetical protein